jgi:pSer/pThr/pTyr-binding forkhead associated (FHA) protein
MRISMSFKFVLVNPESGIPEQTWVLPTPITVGRCPTADITLDDVSISRRHCQFLTDPHGSLIVRDLGSTNGLYVDGRRVEKATVSLGTEVRIGVLVMRVDLTDDELDEISQEKSGAVYDLVDTERVTIVQPEPERYEIG